MFEIVKNYITEKKIERMRDSRGTFYVRKDSKGGAELSSGIYAAKMIDFRLLYKIYLVVSWVRACVDVITKATLSKGWYLEGGEASKKAVMSLLAEPNEDDDWNDVLQNVSEDLLIFGNGFTENVFTGDKLKQIYNLKPTITEVKIDDHGNVTGYSQPDAGVDFTKREVTHFKLSSQGRDQLGVSPLNSLFTPVETDIYAQSYNRAFFKNAARPRGVFSMKGATEEQIKRNREYLRSEFQGPENAHKDLLLEGEVTFKDLQKAPQDVEFLELRKFNREEILAVYGVPPAKLGIIETGNIGAGTGKSQDFTFQNEVVIPHQERIERRINRKIVRDAMGIVDCVFRFNKASQDAEEADTDEKVARKHQIYLQSGVMTPDEVRAELGLTGVIKKGMKPRASQPADWVVNSSGFKRTKNTVEKELRRQELLTVTAVAKARSPEEVAALVDPDALRDAILAESKHTMQQSAHEARSMVVVKQVSGEFGPGPDDFEGIKAALALPIKDFADGLRESIKEALSDGIRAGEDVQQLRDRVSGAWSRPRTISVGAVVDDSTGETIREATTRTISNTAWAELVARTETIRATATGRAAAFRDMGVTMVNILTATGAEEECLALAAAGPYPVDEAGGLLPVHPNCILPNQEVVIPDLVAAAKSFYIGRAIEIRFADGGRLAVTENHPIATTRGWVAAKFLCQGDDVLRCSDFHGMTKRVYLDDDYRPSRIEQIVSTLEKSCGMSTRRVKVSPENLHGDGRGIQGKIDIIGPHRLLWGDGKSSIAQPRGHSFLGQIGSGHLFNAMCSAGQFFNRSLATFDRFVGGLRPALALGGSGLSHPQIHGLRAIALSEPSPIEMPHNAYAGEPRQLRDFLNRASGFVQSDKIVNVRAFDFSGHVYDLQSGLFGLYHAGAGKSSNKKVIVSNCRCTIVPVIETPGGEA